MRRAIVATAVLIAAVAGAPLPASAVRVWEIGIGTIGVSDHSPGAPGGPGSGGSGSPGNDGGGGSGGTVRSYAYWTIGWDGDRFCRQLRYTTDPDLAAAYDFGDHRRFAGGNASGNAAICPLGTTPAGAPVAVPTPDQIARDFWTVRLLPAPTLHMSPGYAVAGKPVYLQLGGEQRKRFDVPNPVGPGIVIEATSRYVIDWGDGATTTTTSQGGAWPHGDVTHTYTTSSPARTIRVAQHWSATWRAGDQQGTLDTLRTDAALTFRVTQVQAVRG